LSNLEILVFFLNLILPVVLVFSSVRAHQAQSKAPLSKNV
jgi:hypothetical protein